MFTRGYYPIGWLQWSPCSILFSSQLVWSVVWSSEDVYSTHFTRMVRVTTWLQSVDNKPPEPWPHPTFVNGQRNPNGIGTQREKDIFYPVVCCAGTACLPTRLLMQESSGGQKERIIVKVASTENSTDLHRVAEHDVRDNHIPNHSTVIWVISNISSLQHTFLVLLLSPVSCDLALALAHSAQRESSRPAEAMARCTMNSGNAPAACQQMAARWLEDRWKMAGRWSKHVRPCGPMWAHVKFTQSCEICFHLESIPIPYASRSRTPSSTSLTLRRPVKQPIDLEPLDR